MSKELRIQFYKETGDAWENSQGEPDIDYVQWLEKKLSRPSALSDEEIDKIAGKQSMYHAVNLTWGDGAKWYRDNSIAPSDARLREALENIKVESYTSLMEDGQPSSGTVRKIFNLADQALKGGAECNHNYPAIPCPEESCDKCSNCGQKIGGNNG